MVWGGCRAASARIIEVRLPAETCSINGLRRAACRMVTALMMAPRCSSAAANLSRWSPSDRMPRHSGSNALLRAVGKPAWRLGCYQVPESAVWWLLGPVPQSGEEINRLIGTGHGLSRFGLLQLCSQLSVESQSHQDSPFVGGIYPTILIRYSPARRIHDTCIETAARLLNWN